MDCPSCGRKTVVSATRREGLDVRRWRRCENCDQTFRTRERVERASYEVVKSDGSQVAFDAKRLRRTILEATGKRLERVGADVDVANDVVQDVFNRAYEETHGAPVPSRRIAELVMERLREVDHSCQIRFALVYKGRTDRDDDGWTEAHQLRNWLISEYGPAVTTAGVANPTSQVLKRNGFHVEFNIDKLHGSVEIACRGRTEADRLASRVVSDVFSELGSQRRVTTGQIASAAMRSLAQKDVIAYLRYTALYKDFFSPWDYLNELEAVPETRSRASASQDASSA